MEKIRVRVYKNLRNGLWSVLHKTDKGWRLLCHAMTVALSDAVPVVYESGRQRVLKEKRKNVHAFIEGSVRLGVGWRYDGLDECGDIEDMTEGYGGDWDPSPWWVEADSFGLASYNPYASANFWLTELDGAKGPWSDRDVPFCIMHAGCEKYRQQIMCWFS